MQQIIAFTGLSGFQGAAGGYKDAGLVLMSDEVASVNYGLLLLYHSYIIMIGVKTGQICVKDIKTW